MRTWRRFAGSPRAGLLSGLCALISVGFGGVAAAEPPQPTFDIEAYDVDGNKLLEEIEVEKAVYPFLGPGRTSADVDHAREALEKAYHDRGYQSVVVETPPQSVSDNIIRLHVVEAPVGRLRVTGSRYFSPQKILQQTPALQQGQVPDITEAQKELADVNRLPDRRVTPLLKAGQAPGTVDVDLKVNDTFPLHASLEVSNDHSQNTEPLRLTGTVHYDNLWQLGHSVTFTYAVAPQDRSESEIFAASYLAPIWGTPWSILAYGYDSNSNVAALGGAAVLGKGYAIGLRGILQLPHVSDLAQSVSFGLDFKNFDQTVGVTTPSPADNIQYWPVDVTYNIQRDGPKFGTKVSLGLTAGIRGLGTGPDEFDNKRFGATSNWIHFNLDLTQTEALGHGFQAMQKLSGQITDQPLVSNEQFSAGGLTSVRGYLQSEVVGDDGFTGALELRAPSMAPKFARFIDDLRLYVFTDGGVVSVLDPLPEQEDFFSLASAGAGLRFQVLSRLTGELVLAMPLIAGPATPADHPVVTFSVKSAF